MAVTKLANGLLARAGSVAGRALWPGLMAFQAGSDLMSGEKNLGEAAGDLVGMTAGWTASQKAMNHLTSGIKNKWVKTPLGFLGAMAGSMAASSIAGSALGKIMPWQRKPQNAQDYLQSNMNGDMTNG